MTTDRFAVWPLIRRFAAAAHATAALEFAFVAPILALIVVSLPDLCSAAVGAVNMESAVRSSIQYAMNGGTDMTVAQALGNQGWAAKPEGATLTASQSCTCPAELSATCGQLCSDGTTPYNYITVVASATLGGSIISFPKTVTQTVRSQ